MLPFLISGDRSPKWAPGEKKTISIPHFVCQNFGNTANLTGARGEHTVLRALVTLILRDNSAGRPQV